jgi:hypothetical protein
MNVIIDLDNRFKKAKLNPVQLRLTSKNKYAEDEKILAF